MPTQTELTNDLIAAATSLKTTFEGKRDEIDTAVDTAIDALDTAKANIVADEAATAASRSNVEADETAVAASKANVDANEAAVNAVLANVQNLRDEWPSLNLISTNGFKLSAQTWVGFTGAENGFGTNPNNWDYTEEYINLNDTSNQVINDLRAATAIGPMVDDQGNFYVRKITITKVGVGNFYTGIGFANKPHQMSGGYMRKLPGGVWEMYVDTPSYGKRHFDWGAYTHMGTYVLNDEIYMALPFVVMGVPAAIPITQPLATNK